MRIVLIIIVVLQIGYSKNVYPIIFSGELSRIKSIETRIGIMRMDWIHASPWLYGPSIGYQGFYRTSSNIHSLKLNYESTFIFVKLGVSGNTYFESEKFRANIAPHFGLSYSTLFDIVGGYRFSTYNGGKLKGGFVNLSLNFNTPAWGE